MAETNEPLSSLAAKIPSYSMVKAKLECPQGAAVEVCRRTRELFATRPGATFNDQDGLRVDLSEGWVGVRGSNTEPILRIFAEARDARTAEGLVAQVRKIAEDVIARG
jgi:phosphomannomutase